MHYIFTILWQSNLFNVWDILNVSILTHKFCLSSFSDYESSVLISGRPNQTHIPYSYFVPISPPSPRPSPRWQQSRSADTVSDILSLTSLGAREGSAGNLASFWTPSLDERFLLIRKFRIWAEHQASEIILIFEILLIETFSWDSPEVVSHASSWIIPQTDITTTQNSTLFENKKILAFRNFLQCYCQF